jgi:hypothetical protein
MAATGEEGFFLYSGSTGIVGFAFSRPHALGRRVYWMEGQAGFGATK